MTTLIPATGLEIPDPTPQSGIWQPLVATPTRLKALTTLAVVLAVALGAVVSTAAADLRAGLRRAGGREAPQSLAAADLYLRLSDLDSALAGMLAAARAKDGAGRTEALSGFQRALAGANADLLRLSALTGGDPAARREVRTLLDGLGRYQALAAAPRPDRPQATALMRATLLPAAERLADAGAHDLDRTYRERSAAAAEAADRAMWLGLALLAVLAALSASLARRHRRLINPLVALVTLAALVFTVASVRMLASQEEELRPAKDGAFDSARALWTVRAAERDAAAVRRRTASETWPAPPDRSHELARVEKALRYSGTVPGGSLGLRKEEILMYAQVLDRERFLTAYDPVLERMAEADRRDVRRRLAAALRETGPWEGRPLGGAAVLAALLIIGVRPRLAEYR